MSGWGLGYVFKHGNPPQPPLTRGENLLKVPLFKGDLGGLEAGGEGKKTRPSPQGGIDHDRALNAAKNIL